MTIADGHLSDIPIHMTACEIDLFERYLRKSKYYLEYGCGGSTEAAVRLKVGRVISIDSDKKWIEKLRKKKEIDHAIEIGKLKMIHVDIGPVGAWGAPTDKSIVNKWPNYFLTPFQKFSYDFDTILIDGRFRVGCALACHAFIKDDAVMIMHDYRIRDGYSEIEKFFEIIEYKDNLFVFIKKPIINPRSFYVAVINSILKP